MPEMVADRPANATGKPIKTVAGHVEGGDA